MNCPKCDKESSCGCNSCVDIPSEYVRNIMEGDFITCPYCGYKNSYDVWLDFYYRYIV